MSNKDHPPYIEGAMFLRPEEEFDEELYPRDPLKYTPSDKFLDRFNRLGGIINSDDVQETIRYGKMYPSARGTVSFVKDLGGVILYIVVTADVPTDEDNLAPREATEKYPSLQIEDLDHSGITIWPYLFSRDKALDTGRWSTKQLKEIQEIEPDQEIKDDR